MSPKCPLVSKVISATSAVSGVSRQRILSDCRMHETVMARQAAMRIIHASGRLSSFQIGQCFNREHTTVLHNIKVAMIAAARDPKVAAMHAEIAKLAGRDDLDAAVASTPAKPSRPPVMVVSKRKPAPPPLPLDASHLPELKKLRRLGWSHPGLARRFECSEAAVCRALGEPVPGSAAA